MTTTATARPALIHGLFDRFQRLLAAPPTLLHSIGGLVVLVVIQVLNVFKPRGLTPYGWRKQQEDRARVATGSAPAVGR